LLELDLVFFPPRSGIIWEFVVREWEKLGFDGR